MFSRTNLIDGAFQLFKLGRYELCKKKAMEILKDSPDDDMAYYILAIAEMEQGKLNRARKHIYQAIRIDPEYASHYNIAAMISTKKSEFKKALKESGEALKITTRDAFVWEVKGWAHYNLLQFDEAWECCQQGLMLEPEHTGCLRQRALILEEREKHEEAAASAREFLGHDPENDKAHFILARNLWLSGNAKDAVMHYREAIRLKPDNVEARKGLRKSRLGAEWPLFKHYLLLLDKRLGRFLLALAGLAAFIITLATFPGVFGVAKFILAVGFGVSTVSFLLKAPQYLAEFILREDPDLRKVIFESGIMGRLFSWISLSVGIVFILAYTIGIYDPLLGLGLFLIAYVPFSPAMRDDMSDTRTGSLIVWWICTLVMALGLILSFTPIGFAVVGISAGIASFLSLTAGFDK